MPVENKNYIYDTLKGLGFNFFVNVPSSFLSEILANIEDDQSMTSITASNEEEGLSIAAGAFLSGLKPVLLCQSDGLGKLLNVLTSLCISYKIPVLIISDLRGSGCEENVVHIPLGRNIQKILSILRIKCYNLNNLGNSLKILTEAKFSLEKNLLPVVVLIDPSVLNKRNNLMRKRKARYHLSRNSCIKAILDETKHMRGDTLIFASLGYQSRALYQIMDSNNNFYVLGAMGMTCAIALGTSCNVTKQIFCIVGDGEILENIGILTTLSVYKSNVVLIIIDNESYESTGGQPTVTAYGPNLTKIASACGIKNSFEVTNLAELKFRIKECLKQKRTTVIVAKTNPSGLPPKRINLIPEVIKKRFMASIKGTYSKYVS